MPIKLIPEFWRNQEIPEKLCKRYEQVKPDLLQKKSKFYSLFQNSAIPSPDQPLDILCLANLNGFAKNKS